jgi:inosine-uridine nucleoside N-ribohydrolase
VRPRLVLDTDIDTDCDDAGALALLHGLVTHGEIELLGVVCSVPVTACAACVAAINAWYDRANLPVGLTSIPEWSTAPAHAPYRSGRERISGRLYNEVIGRDWQSRFPAWTPEDGVVLYRRLLATAPERGVTICAIGTLSALARLLDSAADELSPLTGFELVRRKAGHLVTMAVGSFPRGRDPFNWAMDRAAAARVLSHWPGPLTVSEWGETVLTGARFMAVAPETHPVRTAYRLYLGGTDRSRSSWDQLACLWAARQPADLFDVRRGYTLRFDAATGDHEWMPADPDSPAQFSLQPKVSNAELACQVEDLMIASLQG